MPSKRRIPITAKAEPTKERQIDHPSHHDGNGNGDGGPEKSPTFCQLLRDERKTPSDVVVAPSPPKSFDSVSAKKRLKLHNETSSTDGAKKNCTVHQSSSSHDLEELTHVRNHAQETSPQHEQYKTPPPLKQPDKQYQKRGVSNGVPHLRPEQVMSMPMSEQIFSDKHHRLPSRTKKSPFNNGEKKQNHQNKKYETTTSCSDDKMAQQSSADDDNINMQQFKEADIIQSEQSANTNNTLKQKKPKNAGKIGIKYRCGKCGMPRKVPVHGPNGEDLGEIPHECPFISVHGPNNEARILAASYNGLLAGIQLANHSKADPSGRNNDAVMGIIPRDIRLCMMQAFMAGTAAATRSLSAKHQKDDDKDDKKDRDKNRKGDKT